MMTWYEKCYGEPPPVKEKATIVFNRLRELLRQEEIKRKEAAWHKAKHDYMEYLRKQQKDINIDPFPTI